MEYGERLQKRAGVSCGVDLRQGLEQICLLYTSLISMERYTDAQAVLRAAAKMATHSGDKALVENRLGEIAQIQAMRAQAAAQAATPAGTHVEEQVVDVVPAPKHPTEPRDGPKHTAEGVIRSVTLSLIHI